LNTAQQAGETIVPPAPPRDELKNLFGDNATSSPAETLDAPLAGWRKYRRVAKAPLLAIWRRSDHKLKLRRYWWLYVDGLAALLITASAAVMLARILYGG
jgi:hypothetical protein